MCPVILQCLFVQRIKAPVADLENLLHHLFYCLTSNNADIAIIGNESDSFDFRLKLPDEFKSLLDVIWLFQYSDIVVFIEFLNGNTVFFCERNLT